MQVDKPSFLHGTFLWDEGGYSFAELPRVQLTSSEAVSSHNSWIVLAAILERAKHGDHSQIPLLAKWLSEENDPFLVSAAAELLGDAGARKDLEILPSLMLDGSDTVRVAASRAAYWSGCLWLVPFMIEAWTRLDWRDDKDTVSYMLSDLLEEEAGPIVAYEGYSADEYTQRVRGAVEHIRSKVGSDDLPVWEGRRFGVTSFASRMSRLLQSEEQPSDIDFETYRHKFEASTGIDCTRFFRDARFQPLAAAHTLEEFLESPTSAHFQEGSRYFFGHAI